MSSIKRRESSARAFGGRRVIRREFPKGSGAVLYGGKKKKKGKELDVIIYIKCLNNILHGKEYIKRKILYYYI